MSTQQSQIIDIDSDKPLSAKTPKKKKQFHLWYKIDMGPSWSDRLRYGWIKCNFATETAREQGKEYLLNKSRQRQYQDIQITYEEPEGE